MNNAETNGSSRYLSLDVLRGMTITLMIVVNTPGTRSAIYASLKHAAWHGFTLTDLVFPTFLFVVGNALAFSMKRYEFPGLQKQFLQKAFRRALTIFFIGLLLNQFPFVMLQNGGFVLKSWANIRLFGVLQRIAICYFIASLMIYYFPKKVNIILAGIILSAYWAMLYFFGDHGDPYSLAGNAVLKLDLLIVPEKNLYQGYGLPFDPEGLLSCLPAIVNVLIGYFAGRALQQKQSGTMSKFLTSGVAMVVIAWAWHSIFPINKSLWTSSYVLLTVGIDLLVLGVLILVIDRWKWIKWAGFFVVFGKNALFIYILAWTVNSILYLFTANGMPLPVFIHSHYFASWLNAYASSFLYAISYMLFIWLFALIMDLKRIYIKV